MTEVPPSQTSAFKLEDEPGHLIRRAQQLAVSTFHAVHGRHVTPIQYAILCTLSDEPGIDQVTLAQKVALDNSTAADIAARLEAKGWILRELLPSRQRRLSLTADGQGVLQALRPQVDALYAKLMRNLEPHEQSEFMRLLRKFVEFQG
jgi:DNA-binding MarR family transcriptional regulator